jgi:hypothetical protein
MNPVQIVVTVSCLLGALGLAFAGTYWLGMRNAYRQVSRDLMEVELQQILADADEDNGGGVEVLA